MTLGDVDTFWFARAMPIFIVRFDKTPSYFSHLNRWFSHISVHRHGTEQD